MAEEYIGRQGPEGTVALERKNVLEAKVQKGLYDFRRRTRRRR